MRGLPLAAREAWLAVLAALPMRGHRLQLSCGFEHCSLCLLESGAKHLGVLAMPKQIPFPLGKCAAGEGGAISSSAFEWSTLGVLAMLAQGQPRKMCLQRCLCLCTGKHNMHISCAKHSLSCLQLIQQSIQLSGIIWSPREVWFSAAPVVEGSRGIYK